MIVVIAAAVALASGGSDSTGVSNPNPSCPSFPCTVSTPGISTFTVPVGITSLTVQVWGADGARRERAGRDRLEMSYPSPVA